LGSSDPRSEIKKRIKYWTEVRDKWKGEYEKQEVRLKKAEELGADNPKNKWHSAYKSAKEKWIQAEKFWTEAEEHLQTLDKHS
jgi:hypothetical protein